MALIPPFFSDCVTALGVPGDEGSPPAWTGSAFFYGHPLSVDEADGQMRYATYIVSNKHVFGDHPRLMVRANPQSDEVEAIARDFNIDLQTEADGVWSRSWFGHPDDDVDVAVV